MPKVKFGTIASGSLVIDDIKKQQLMRRRAAFDCVQEFSKRQPRFRLFDPCIAGKEINLLATHDGKCRYIDSVGVSTTVAFRGELSEPRSTGRCGPADCPSKE